jgi:prophage tail gpP-like protein
MYLYSGADGAALSSLYEQAVTGVLLYGSGQSTSATDSTAIINIYDYADTTTNKIIQSMAQGEQTSPLGRVSFVIASVEATAAITDITIAPNTGTFSAGTYTLYGVK